MGCCKIIRGGFSFCGVDIADLHLSYAPEKEHTYVYRPAEVDVHQETFAGHDGGYLYGVTRKPKEFLLRCYFEDESIDQGIMEQIYHLFRMGKSGKLVFSRKPWCYYYATVTSSPHPELSNYLNGMITITMTASYPFARGDAMFYNPEESKNIEKHQKIDENDFVLKSTALLEHEEWVPSLEPTKSYPITAAITAGSPILLHNPGTERSPLSVILSGDVGDGVLIKNITTKQECNIIALGGGNKYIYIDGLNGNTSLITYDNEYNIISKEPGFVYHDYGFIDLSPAYPVVREVFMESASGDRLTLYNNIYQDVTGYYIYAADKWIKIVDQELLDESNQTVLTLKDPADANKISTNRKTTITKMNEITITPVTTMSLSHLKFSYKPTYA